MTPSDPGLQPERTALAWRRTLLTLAIGALVSLRVLPPVLGGWTVATGLAALAVVAVLWRAAWRRSTRTAAAFDGGADAPLPGGALLAATALLTAGGAVLGLLAVVAGLPPSP